MSKVTRAQKESKGENRGTSKYRAKCRGGAKVANQCEISHARHAVPVARCAICQVLAAVIASDYVGADRMSATWVRTERRT